MSQFVHKEKGVWLPTESSRKQTVVATGWWHNSNSRISVVPIVPQLVTPFSNQQVNLYNM